MQFLFVAEVDNGHFRKKAQLLLQLIFSNLPPKSDYLKSVTINMNEALNKAKKEA